MERLRAAAARLKRSTPHDPPQDDSDYEGWTLARLRRRAAELDVPGRWSMDKDGLIAALRAHDEPGDTAAGASDDPSDATEPQAQ